MTTQSALGLTTWVLEETFRATVKLMRQRNLTRAYFVNLVKTSLSSSLWFTYTFPHNRLPSLSGTLNRNENTKRVNIMDRSHGNVEPQIES